MLACIYSLTSPQSAQFRPTRTSCRIWCKFESHCRSHGWAKREETQKAPGGFLNCALQLVSVEYEVTPCVTHCPGLFTL